MKIEGVFGTPAGIEDACLLDRIGFVRKVLGILTAQLIITALVTLIPLHYPSARLFLSTHPTLLCTMFLL